MNIEIIVGNICAIGSTLSDSFSGTRKSNKGILLAQCISQLFYIVSSVVLKGYSATVQNVVAIFRNIFAAYEKDNKFLQLILTILPVVLGFVFNNRGIIGLLPVVANLEYSISVFLFKGDPEKLKYAFVINVFMYSVFNFYIFNFVGGLLNIITATTTIIAIYKSKKETSN